MGEIVNIGDDGIVYITYKKNMNDANVDLYISELTEIVESSREKLRILTDIGPADINVSSQRTRIAEGIRPLRKNILKSAVIGSNNPFKKAVVQIVLHMSGRKDVKLFDNKEDAVRWLRY